MSAFRSALWIAFVTSFLVHAKPARAEGDEAKAEHLFQEGKRLMAERVFPAACDRLEESQRLDPAGGTLFALAVCYEEEGRLATAWRMFGDALALATRDQRADRETLSRAHRARLEPRLPRLELHTTVTNGVRVDIDGDDVPAERWPITLSLDPGAHRIRVSSIGHRTHEQSVSLEEGKATVVHLLPLEPIAPSLDEPKPVDRPKLSTEATPWLRITGWSLVGVGAGLTAFGAYSGLRAFAKKDAARSHCDARDCDATGLDLLAEGRASATRADVALGLGVGALVVGVVMLLWEQRTQTARGAVAAF